MHSIIKSAPRRTQLFGDSHPNKNINPKMQQHQTLLVLCAWWASWAMMPFVPHKPFLFIVFSYFSFFSATSNIETINILILLINNFPPAFRAEIRLLGSCTDVVKTCRFLYWNTPSQLMMITSSKRYICLCLLFHLFSPLFYHQNGMHQNPVD